METKDKKELNIDKLIKKCLSVRAKSNKQIKFK